jgi:superfamily II DNA or RNA helicase
MDQITISRDKLKEFFKLNNIEFNEKNFEIEKINPRDYQEKIIKESIDYYRNNDNGVLNLPCGLGKTYLSLFIIRELKMRKILIGVPNLELLKQWYNSIKELNYIKNILMISSDNISELEDIKKFIKHNKEEYIIITSYASSYKLLKCKLDLDMKIYDEMHHLVNMNLEKARDKKSYIKILEVESKKQLGLTATLKILETFNNNNIISNDNKEIYGEIITKRNLEWCISNNIVCDYNISLLSFNEEEIKDYNDNTKEKNLLIASIASLKSIKNKTNHHILIYCNSTKNAIIIKDYITEILEKEEYNEIRRNLYYSEYNSKMDEKSKHQSIKLFTKSEYGILINCFCLSQGWSSDILDCVIFAEEMSSEIRIVQSSLRCCRKNKNEPNKIGNLLLPILEDDLQNEESSNFNKIKKIIKELSFEDDNIIQKIKLNKSKIKEEEENKIQNKLEKIEDENNEGDLEEFLLKTLSKYYLLSYEKIKKVLKQYNLKSINDYNELIKKKTYLPNNPKELFKKKFIDWIDYLSINRSDYYNINDFRNKIYEECPNINTLLLINNQPTKIIEYVINTDKKMISYDLIEELYKKSLKDILLSKNKTKLI